MASLFEQTIQRQINVFKLAIDNTLKMSNEQPLAYLNLSTRFVYNHDVTHYHHITNIGAIHLKIHKNNLFSLMT